jgi:hypothetical protein
MQKRARPGKLLAALAHFPPVFVVFLPAQPVELVQLLLLFQFDLKFGDVVVFGVVEIPEKNSIHHLGDLFGVGLDGEVHLDVEHEDFIWNALV